MVTILVNEFSVLIIVSLRYVLEVCSHLKFYMIVLACTCVHYILYAYNYFLQQYNTVRLEADELFQSLK